MFKRKIEANVGSANATVSVTYESSFKEIGNTSVMLDNRLLDFGSGSEIVSIGDEEVCKRRELHDKDGNLILFIENEILYLEEKIYPLSTVRKFVIKSSELYIDINTETAMTYVGNTSKMKVEELGLLMLSFSRTEAYMESDN